MMKKQGWLGVDAPAAEEVRLLDHISDGSYAHEGRLQNLEAAFLNLSIRMTAVENAIPTLVLDRSSKGKVTSSEDRVKQLEAIMASKNREISNLMKLVEDQRKTIADQDHRLELMTRSEASHYSPDIQEVS
jgi:uncharacterized coiled-coil protein SlyX